MPPRERRCNSVRKVVHPGATEFTYEREVQPLPRLGPWKEALEPAGAWIRGVGAITCSATIWIG